MLAMAPMGQAQPRVPILGDSLVQGFGLPQADGLVPQLQTWLDGQGAEVILINAGVSGDTTQGGRARIGWTLSGGADALIVALGGNDLLRGLPPELVRANLAAILEAAGERPVLLVAIEAPLNYGPAYKQEFDGIFADLATEYGARLYPGFFTELAGIRDDPTAFAAMMQPDGIHPSAAGVTRIVQGFGPVVFDWLQEVQARP